MIVTLISFEAIEVLYTSEVDPHRHVVVDENSPGVFTVVKEGIALRELFQTMLKSKSQKIQEQNQGSTLSSPIFVCLSAKNKKTTQPIFKAICPDFQHNLLYFNIDKSLFEPVVFNRAMLFGSDICFGEGLSQLRVKQELRIALLSILKPFSNIEFIFIQRNPNQIKELKKQGFTNVVDRFESLKFKQVFDKTNDDIKKVALNTEYSIEVKEWIEINSFSKAYLQTLLKINKNPQFKKIEPFEFESLSISGFLKEFSNPSTFYNITPKSWINNSSSKEISSYIFHNMSDNRLYIARASKPKQFSNQEETEAKVLAYFLNFLIHPSALAVPHYKNTTLMKFSKIKTYENKKAFLNIRPYIEGLRTMGECGLGREDYKQLIQTGHLYGRKIIGLGGILLFSWFVNENLNIKTLSQQVTFLNNEKNAFFTDKSRLKSSQGNIYLCRTDFFSIFNMSTFKVIENKFTITRFGEEAYYIKIQDLHESYIQEMCHLVQNLSQQRTNMIRNLFIYYRWNTKLSSFYEVVNYRLQIIQQNLGYFKMQPSKQRPLLYTYPLLSCLLMPQDYSQFLLPLKNTYFPMGYSYQDSMAEQKINQNPYLTYMNKTCSFAIYKFDFPVLTFMQWVKAGGKYQIIEYISMISKSLEDYLVMDKKLKLTTVNDKKNVVLIVDHAECCEEIISKPKSIKTVMIFRLKKPSAIEDFGLISSDLQKKQEFQQSDDELINVLFKWGLNFDFFSSKIELYNWILSSYSDIKTTLFNLPQPGNQEFMITLHREISTNRHRLKELEENHKDRCRYLYTYPIFKELQKITFNYRLFEFILLKSLFSDILQGKWSCRLQTYQNASVTLLRPLVEPNLAAKIVKRLMIYLNQISSQTLDIDQYKMLTNDVLELIRTLTQPSSNASVLEEPFSLYFSVFTEIVKIQNYFIIQTSLMMEKILVVIDDSNIELNFGNESLKIQKGEIRVIDLVGIDKKLTLFSFQQKNKDFFINEVEIETIPIFGYKKVYSQSISSSILKQLLTEVEWKKIKINKKGDFMNIAMAFDQKLRIVTFNIFDQQSFGLREEVFGKTILDLHFLLNEEEESTLLITTSEQILKYSIWQTSIQEKPFQLVRVNFGITNVLFHEIQGELIIVIYKLHIIERYVIVKNEVIQSQRYQLKRNIKVMTLKERILYVFYENCDSMDLLVFHGEKLETLWSYYWIEANCQGIHVKGEDLFLRGIGYIKHARLRNPESLQEQMMKFD